MIAVVLFAIAAIACWQGLIWYWNEFTMPPGNCSYLESLRTEDARADADRAIARHDPHLLGVYGYDLSVPAAETEAEQLGHQVRPIDCTSDAILSRKRARLNSVATAYASIYNRRILGLSPN